MRLILDGNDWRADYYLPEKRHEETALAGHLDGMLLDSARSAGIIGPGAPPAGSFHATIPGCDRTILLENGEIADPYFGRNLEHSRWSETMEWAFRKDFMLPKSMQACRGYRLVLRSAGYSAQLFLNGEYLGEREGMFTPWEFDVTDFLRPRQTNALCVIFRPAPQAKPNHCYDRPAEFSRWHTCQMSFGWDWARPMVPTGIYDTVELIGVDAARVRDCVWRTDGRKAHVEAELGVLESGPLTVSLRLAPLEHPGRTIRMKKTIAGIAGQSAVVPFDFEVPDAKFWHPNGAGPQPLYALEVTVAGDQWRRQVGFRDLEMHRNPGSPEDAYPLTFCVNGQTVFVKGLNWVPADLMYSRPTPEDYERLVRLAAEAGFNLFRVWGGGIIEKQSFYDACDRHGILVWQEFMHACSRYPTTPDYLAYQTKEGESIIRRLRTHVSTALFCGGNEMQAYGETADSPLYRQYGELVARLAPGIPYHLASPDLSRPGERLHGPWRFYEHSFWNQHTRLFASELGDTSLAEAESIARFIPKGDPCLTGQHWKYHFSENHRLPLQGFLDEFQAQPGDVWQASQVAMFQQADQLGYIMEHYRRLSPAASGCNIWQYNESWPTNAYSIVDYYTMPKMAYYRLAQANQTVMLHLEDDGWKLSNHRLKGRLFLCNDGESLCHADLCVQGFDLAGQTIFHWRQTADCLAGTTPVGTLDHKIPKALSGHLLLVRFCVSCQGKTLFQGERLFGVPDFSQALHLEKTRLSGLWNVCKTASGRLLQVRLRNQGASCAVMVRASLPGLDSHRRCYWRQNYLCILPGEERQLCAALDDAADIPPYVLLRGWNVPLQKIPPQ